MVNSKTFADRLRIIMDYYALNASSFADSIGVQRSGISHILAGRNKPSLDFVLKVIEEFTEVNLYWLLMGKGNFPATETVTQPPEDNIADSIPARETAAEKKTTVLKTAEKEHNEIAKIIVLYKNGSFDSFEN